MYEMACNTESRVDVAGMEMSLPLARLDAFEGSQSVLNVAAHSYLVVEGSSDYALCVYDVCNPRRA